MSGGGKDYDVGYGKPPEHTQFKKGQSGNPSGKRKGERNMRSLIAVEGDELVELREGGVAKRISKREAAVKALYQRALTGDPRAFRTLVDLGLFDRDDGAAEDYGFTGADLSVLKTHSDWVGLLEEAGREAADETE